eukprot:comp21672_c0_seq1/m.30498 comp21672_c0_seq1/g.30498  ORF comp21672_c0_seq1/g.30498 comp21672_c0_seq1/m.30498 type:complete len:1017 (-) comp21672_c0_seq1:48-3098(-)
MALSQENRTAILQHYASLVLVLIAVSKGALDGSLFGLFLLAVAIVSVPTFVLRGDGSKTTTAAKKGASEAKRQEAVQARLVKKDAKDALQVPGKTHHQQKPSTSSSGSSGKKLSFEAGDRTSASSSPLPVRSAKIVIPPPAQLPVSIRAIPETPNGEDVDLGNAPIILPNSREPIAFECERFKGTALVKFRTDPLDPVYAPYFEGKSRTFEFQIQGRFKQAMGPGDRLLFGIEIPEYLSLGLVGRGIIRVMLAVANRIISGVHSSLGDKKIGELPHLMFPIETTVDRLLITPDGETPPALCIPMLPEGLDKKARANLHLVGDLNHTYTISMHGMYVDFVKWTLCNMPGMGSVDLRSIVGDNPMRLIGYVLPADYKGPHVPEMKKYCFNFHMEHSGGEVVFNQPESDTDSICSGNSGIDQEDGEPTSIPSSPSAEVIDLPVPLPGHARPVQPVEVDDKIKITSVSCPAYIEGADTARGTWFVIEVTEETGKTYTLLKRKSELALSLEAIAEKVEGPHHLPSFLSDNPMRRSSSARALASAVLPDRQSTGTTRLQQNEHSRPELSEYLQRALAAPNGSRAVRQFLEGPVDSKIRPMVGTKRDMGISASHASTIAHEGPIARAVWESRWVESWAVLDTATLCLYGHYNRRAEVHISLLDITSVCDLKGPEPFRSSFLEVHTIGRVYYLAMATAGERDLWRMKLQSQMAALGAASTDLSAEVADPLETYTTRSRRRWDSDRMVMNERRMYFGRQESVVSPNDQIEHILRLAFACHVESPKEKLIEYLDASSTLKLISMQALAGLSQAQRLSFFLNMYHCLVAHSLLILGSPKSSREVSRFFSDSSFEVGGQVFSISEIEQNILRASMVNPLRRAQKTPIKRFFPDDPRAALGLTRADRRIMFVLNNGSQACGDRVPIYSSNTGVCSAQMDEVCRRFLDMNLVVNLSKKTVTLPKVCEQYQADFGDNKLEVVMNLMEYCSKAKREEINKVVDSLRDKDIRFAKDVGFVERLTLLPLVISPK